MATLDKIKEYIKEIRTFRTRDFRKVTRQYVYLRDLPRLNKPRVRAVNPNYPERIFRQRVPRKIKQAIGIERKEQKDFSNVIETIDKLLPLITEPYFNQLGKLKQELVTHHGAIVLALSQKGTFSKLLDAHRGLNIGDDLLAKEISGFLERILLPYLSVLARLDHFCEKETAILEAKKKVLVLRIPLDRYLASHNHGFTPTVVIIDTSFLRQISLAQQRAGMELLNMTFPAKTAYRYVPKKVLSELKRGGVSLSNQQLAYLRTWRFRVLDVKPTKKEVAEILTWWKGTPKFRRSSPKERRDFMNSADLDILVLAMRFKNSGKKVAILSQDTDISGTVGFATAFKERKSVLWRNVRVYNYYDKLQRAA